MALSREDILALIEQKKQQEAAGGTVSLGDRQRKGAFRAQEQGRVYNPSNDRRSFSRSQLLSEIRQKREAAQVSQRQAARDAQPTPEKWTDVLPEAWENLPGSAVNFAGDVARVVTHPVETGESLLRAGAGGLQLLGDVTGTSDLSEILFGDFRLGQDLSLIHI